MLVGSRNVRSSMGFRDFFIVAPAFYECMVIELKKSWQKVSHGRGEAINLSSYFFPFFPQNPVVISNTHTHTSKLSDAHVES